jgi:hypothetical protein
VHVLYSAYVLPIATVEDGAFDGKLFSDPGRKFRKSQKTFPFLQINRASPASMCANDETVDLQFKDVLI